MGKIFWILINKLKPWEYDNKWDIDMVPKYSPTTVISYK